MVVVYKAQPTGDRHVPDLEILGNMCVPDYEPVPNASLDHYLAQSEAMHDQQAQLLCDALQASLPGGTLDRLIGKLLLAKASHFRVPWSKTP